MSIQNIFRFYLLFIVLINFSCKKDKPIEPPQPAPQAKFNYFECKVDGVDWKPCGPMTVSLQMGQYFQNSYFDLSAHNYCENSEIYFKLNSFFGVSNYILGTDSLSYFVYEEFNDSAIATTFKTDSLRGGFIKITSWDTVRQTISGNFEVEVFSQKLNKVKRITSGKFENFHYYKF